MTFSLHFIKEFLKVDVSPQKLASLLTLAGMEVESLQKRNGDWVFDIEVTSNRYDWLSILGIAREIAVCLDTQLKVAYPKVRTTPLVRNRKILIADTNDCSFYAGRVIRGVTVKESPLWLKERVAHCGINAINNIVDITNYCMLKWGNPLHAFDEDKLEGDMCVRRAKKGEAFIGIDEKERVLTSQNLVIADRKKIIALAGVIGAKNTQVDVNTKNVFLEAAVFSPLTVRRSRRVAGVDTESSYRFERRVSGDCLAFASAQAARLIAAQGKGKESGYIQAGKKPVNKPKPITVRFSQLESYLGEAIPKQVAKRILRHFDFTVKSVSSDVIKVTPSPFRFDVQQPVDVYEELIRIYGYDKIEPQIPFLSSQKDQDCTYEFKVRLRHFLAGLGLHEIVTYSIENDQELAALGETGFAAISNPLRKQENVLRTTLLLGMLKTARYNLNRGARALRLFEGAHVYRADTKGVKENSALAVGMTGDSDAFFALKGVVNELLSATGVKNVSLQETSCKNFTNALSVKSGSQVLGFIGKLDESVCRAFDLKESLFFAHINVDALEKEQGQKRYVSFSAYPAVSRDMSIVLSRDVPFSMIETCIRNSARQFYSDMAIVDRYQGKDVDSHSQAFTLRVFYQSKEKTLTSQEVDSLHTAIREQLAQVQGITLR